MVMSGAYDRSSAAAAFALLEGGNIPEFAVNRIRQQAGLAELSADQEHAIAWMRY